MKYLLLLTLLVGYGQGQTFTMDAAPAKPPNGSLLVLRTSGSVAVPDCDESVSFHGKQKAIKDIFPEECGEPDSPFVPGWSYSCLHIDYGKKRVSGTEDCDAKMHDPGCTASFTLEDGKWDGSPVQWNCPEPEPPDVPAIKGKGCKLTDQQIKQGYCCSRGGWQMDCPHHVDGKPYCADKSRILLTAEDGKKWCHKVQP
jgi:hypothetical protein